MSSKAWTRPSPSCPWSIEVHMLVEPHGFSKHTTVNPKSRKIVQG